MSTTLYTAHAQIFDARVSMQYLWLEGAKTATVTDAPLGSTCHWHCFLCYVISAMQSELSNRWHSYQYLQPGFRYLATNTWVPKMHIHY